MFPEYTGWLPLHLAVQPDASTVIVFCRIAKKWLREDVEMNESSLPLVTYGVIIFSTITYYQSDLEIAS